MYRAAIEAFICGERCVRARNTLVNRTSFHAPDQSSQVTEDFSACRAIRLDCAACNLGLPCSVRSRFSILCTEVP